MASVCVDKGLEGVVVNASRISKVVPEKKYLVYYGYPVQELAEHCSFEEVAHLLLNGELPNLKQLSEFENQERKNRTLSKNLISMIKLFDMSAHPMDTLRTAVSFLGTEDPDTLKDDHKSNYKKSINLLAKIPCIIAANFRHKKGLDYIPPRQDINIGENFFHMCFGEIPPADVIKAFDVSMILYAEHTFNASTFTARVIVSSLSDIYSAVTGAIGSLRGSLHGGANEAVMRMLEDIGDPAKAHEWTLHSLEEHIKIMGFGHRVYKWGDSRVPTMKKYMLKLSNWKGDTRWSEISNIIEDIMLKEKNIYPNLDFPTGPAYYLMGFDIELFTPIFVISRITGWTAHIMEQLNNNRLIRPLSDYTGPQDRSVKPIHER
ncbi:MAG: bifunctional 2-methylcitrate synthase/citrate synthase [Spirochaetota bacterium]|nr:bifunctional 2-methylcitrate synthase/citrate synthase [Spirochaetota bacterium]